MSNNDKLLNFIILIEEKNLFKNKFFYFICDLNNFILFSLVLKFEN